ncbi:rabphilin-3A [Ischnura elegans]|uniref:rabphilin-3A n=1 Tax=Ischnura elegans TaxID=197161 RepID=UPI001ED892C7|nr:rabphilin-3A [Ischnura elegans]XP_046385626.1 rabphilin-3A [Ischnura elegans]
MVDFGTTKDRWVCPNDRQLALRAKLKTGWSVKTQQLQSFGTPKPAALDETEQAAILRVIKRAEALEANEQERIGRLVERLDNMKRNAMGNGTSQCVLCGDSFGMLGAPSLLCHDCKKAVCGKCGIETTPALPSSSTNPTSSNQKEVQWLCKICSETREMWKKSGAWFFKGIPKYVIPEKKPQSSSKNRDVGILKTGVPKTGKSSSGSSSRSRPPLQRASWAKGGGILVNRSLDHDEESSSEDELGRRARLTWASDAASGQNQTSSGDQVIGAGRMAPIAAALNRSTDHGAHWSRSMSTESTIMPSWATKSPNRGTLQHQRSESSSYAGVDGDHLPPSALEAQKHHPTKNPPAATTNLQVSEQDGKSITGSSRDFHREGSAESGDSAGSSGVSRQGTVESIGGRSASSSSSSFSSGGRQKTWESTDGGDPHHHHHQSTPKAIPDSSANRLQKQPHLSRRRRLSESSQQMWPESHSLPPGVPHGYQSHPPLPQPGYYQPTPLEFQQQDFSYPPQQSRHVHYYHHSNQDVGQLLPVDGQDPPEEAYLGILEFSLLYDSVTCALHCLLHRAKGLRAMDIHGLADPFCKLFLLPRSSNSHGLRSKTVHKTRNPEFNETLSFHGVTEADIEVTVLRIVVLDDDKYGHDFIGEVRAPLKGLRPQQTRHLNVYLGQHIPVTQKWRQNSDDSGRYDDCRGSYGKGKMWLDQNSWSYSVDSIDDEDKTPDEEDWEDVGDWDRGRILLTLCYSTRRRALVVGVIRCVNLAAMDTNGFSDPFVKLHLKPDPHHRKYKTSIKWKNLNPEFNEQFVFETKATDLSRQALVITVWDKDYGKSNDYLGGLELGWKSKGERLQHWVDTIKFPDRTHERWHHLSEEVLSD